MLKENKSSTENKMRVEIWSDVMCPFCFLGKHKFEESLLKFPEKDRVEVIWKSFQLNPDLKTDTSVSIYDYLSEIKGFRIEQAKLLNMQLADSAKEYGIEFNFDKVVVANTFRAHNFLHYAKKQGKQSQAEESLFRAYFSEGKNVDDISVLNEIGRGLGLENEQLEEVLKNSTYYDDVRRDIYEAHQLGIRGVPFFVFNNKYGVSGAQDSAIFLQVIEKAYAEWHQSNSKEIKEVIKGESCGLEGNC